MAQPFPAPELRTRILRTRGFFWIRSLTPWPSNPCFLAKKIQGHPKKARIALSAKPSESLEKKGKTYKKTRKIAKRKKASKTNKARIGGSGQCRRCHYQIAIAANVREEKGTQTQTFWFGYLRVGWGSSTWRGDGQKVWYVLRNPGKPNFWRDIPGFLAGISRVCPRSLRKKGLCSMAPTKKVGGSKGDTHKGDREKLTEIFECFFSLPSQVFLGFIRREQSLSFWLVFHCLLRKKQGKEEHCKRWKKTVWN